ncbi:MAG: amidohydrolase family protein [Pseudomonadota bacterium]
MSIRKLVLLLVVQFAAASSLADKFDLILENGRILDGTGNPWFAADVGIKNGRISAVRRLDGAIAGRRIDVDGAIVAPGFIDLHSHADDFSGAQTGLRSSDLSRRQAANIVTQGVTTIVVNPDGSAQPGLGIAAQAEALATPGIGVNVILMAAHNAIRYQAMGDDFLRPADEAELQTMATLVRTAMREGAFGLSSGLEYVPGRYSLTDELVSLMGVVGEFGGVHISHIRSETSAPMWWVPSQHEPSPPQLLDGTLEIIEIAERSNTVGVITHMKVRGTTHWGESARVIEMVNAARDRGVQIYGDQYPYSSSGSDGALVLIPAWATASADSGAAADYATALRRTLREAGQVESLRDDIRHAIAFRGGAANIVVFDFPDKTYIGRNLRELALERAITPIDMAIELQLSGYKNRRGGVRLRSFSLHEQDMVALMQQPWVATASDGGIAIAEDGPTVHARYYGTFPRKLGYFAREKKAISLAAAVRSATSLPAQILGLQDRGVIRPDAIADLVVFDPDSVVDQATFSNPHQMSRGIHFVLLAGEMALANGTPTGALLGRVIKKAGGQP